VPGAVITADELNQRAVSADHKVSRDFGAAYLLEIRMGIPIYGVGEQGRDLRAALLTGWQADGVHDDQIDDGVDGPRPKIWRGRVLGKAVPAVSPQQIARCHASALMTLTVRLAAIQALLATNRIVFRHMRAAMRTGQHLDRL